jgi:hypothetical protein
LAYAGFAFTYGKGNMVLPNKEILMQVVEDLFKKTGHKVEVVIDTASLEQAHSYEAKKFAIEYAQGKGCNQPAINGGPNTWWVDLQGNTVQTLDQDPAQRRCRVLWPLEEKIL